MKALFQNTPCISFSVLHSCSTFFSPHRMSSLWSSFTSTLHVLCLHARVFLSQAIYGSVVSWCYNIMCYVTQTSLADSIQTGLQYSHSKSLHNSSQSKISSAEINSSYNWSKFWKHCAGVVACVLSNTGLHHLHRLRTITRWHNSMLNFSSLCHTLVLSNSIWPLKLCQQIAMFCLLSIWKQGWSYS